MRGNSRVPASLGSDVSLKTEEVPFFFFLNQQFITRHAVVDRGSYFVTTYKRSKLHEGKETEERERERGEMEN